MTDNYYKSTCHCGTVELELFMPKGLKDPRRCDCSLCARKGAMMVSVLVEDLKVLKGADKLSLYQFSTKTAKHYFCSVCGIYTHHRRRSNPKEYGVNVACIDGVDIRQLADVPLEDGRSHPSDR